MAAERLPAEITRANLIGTMNKKTKKKTASPGHKNGNESFETVTKWRRKRDSKFPNRAARGRRVRQVRERKLTVER